MRLKWVWILRWNSAAARGCVFKTGRNLWTVVFACVSKVSLNRQMSGRGWIWDVLSIQATMWSCWSSEGSEANSVAFASDCNIYTAVRDGILGIWTKKRTWQYSNIYSFITEVIRICHSWNNVQSNAVCINLIFPFLSISRKSLLKLAEMY